MTESEFNYRVGEHIRVRRLYQKLSRGALAKLVGVHRNTVTRWERGQSIDLRSFLRVCRELQIAHETMLPRSM